MAKLIANDITVGSLVSYKSDAHRGESRTGCVTGITPSRLEINFKETIFPSQVEGFCTSYADYPDESRLTPYGHRKAAIRNAKNASNNNVKNQISISRIVFNGPATIVWFTDGTKTIVKKTEGDTDDREKAILLALTKKLLGNSTADLRRFLKDVESKVDNQNKKGK